MSSEERPEVEPPASLCCVRGKEMRTGDTVEHGDLQESWSAGRRCRPHLVLLLAARQPAKPASVVLCRLCLGHRLGQFLRRNFVLNNVAVAEDVVRAQLLLLVLELLLARRGEGKK